MWILLSRNIKYTPNSILLIFRKTRIHRPGQFILHLLRVSKKKKKSSTHEKSFYKCPGLPDGRIFRRELGKLLSSQGQNVTPVSRILSKCDPCQMVVKILSLHLILFLYSSFPCLNTCVVKSSLLYGLGTAQPTLPL